jgi:hypothetical protein
MPGRPFGRPGAPHPRLGFNGRGGKRLPGYLLGGFNPDGGVLMAKPNVVISQFLLDFRWQRKQSPIFRLRLWVEAILVPLLEQQTFRFVN